MKTGIEMNVNPISTEDYPTRAKRPLNSRLSKENTARAVLDRMPHWEDALTRFIEELSGQHQWRDDQIYQYRYRY